jgi:hypothetical protein
MNATTQPGRRGPSIIESIWAEIDSLVDDIHAVDFEDDEVRMLKAQAQGLALALAILLNLYEPNAPAIGYEAQERYEARQAEAEAASVTQPEPTLKVRPRVRKKHA